MLYKYNNYRTHGNTKGKGCYSSAILRSCGETAHFFPGKNQLVQTKTVKLRYLKHFTCIIWNAMLHLNKIQQFSIIQSLKNIDISNKKKALNQ